MLSPGSGRINCWMRYLARFSAVITTTSIYLSALTHSRTLSFRSLVLSSSTRHARHTHAPQTRSPSTSSSPSFRRSFTKRLKSKLCTECTYSVRRVYGIDARAFYASLALHTPTLKPLPPLFPRARNRAISVLMYRGSFCASPQRSTLTFSASKPSFVSSYTRSASTIPLLRLLRRIAITAASHSLRSIRHPISTFFPSFPKRCSP